MKQLLFTGCCTALVTPFSPNGRINWAAFEQLIEDQLEAGIAALLCCGTTGEGSTLTTEEHAAVVTFCARCTAGRVPVIANVGCNDTAASKLRAKRALQAGADALLVITPYYNKTTQQGLFLHFSQIAQATPLPILLYNVPSRTGLCIAPETYERLAALPNIVGVKEANSDLSAVMKSLRLYESGKLALYSGNDDATAALMGCGAKGVISVLSNVYPQEVSRLCRLLLAGKQREAAALQAKLMPAAEALFTEVNPIPVKYAMALSGLDCGACRLPLCAPSEATKQRLGELFQI